MNIDGDHRTQEHELEVKGKRPDLNTTLLMTPILASWPVQGLPDFKWKGSAVQKCAKVVTRERGNLLRAGHRGTMYVVPSSPQRPSMLPFSPPIVLQCAQRAILSANKWRLARVTPSPVTVSPRPRHPGAQC